MAELLAQQRHAAGRSKRATGGRNDGERSTTGHNGGGDNGETNREADHGPDQEPAQRPGMLDRIAEPRRRESRLHPRSPAAPRRSGRGGIDAPAEAVQHLQKVWFGRFELREASGIDDADDPATRH
jgi:hypothetical protein